MLLFCRLYVYNIYHFISRPKAMLSEDANGTEFQAENRLVTSLPVRRQTGLHANFSEGKIQ
jgi:hypothetical protein